MVSYIALILIAVMQVISKKNRDLSVLKKFKLVINAKYKKKRMLK